MRYLLLLLLHLLLHLSTSTTVSSTYPQRHAHNSAVIEWGNSAIISALDAAVAKFGPQTSRAAYFEVETSIVLANPVDGSSPFTNPDEIHGNMVLVTNVGNVAAMAREVQSLGGVALCVVNTDADAPDYIYTLEGDGEEEVEIPVVMVSLSGGNMLTVAGGEGEEINLPERVRLYAAADRPFFEDVSSAGPVLYLIHNMMTEEECNGLIEVAEPILEELTTQNSVLENYAPHHHSMVGGKVETAFLWKGPLVGGLPKPLGGAFLKEIDERLEQVSGFTKTHFSDFQVWKFSQGGFHAQRIDVRPAHGLTPIVGITIFLNQLEEGGDILYPELANQPVRVRPTRGLAVVHHVLKEDGSIPPHDPSSAFLDEAVKLGVKYVARRYIYAEALSPARRYVLPLLAWPLGGRLPKVIVGGHDQFVEKFGWQRGVYYFDLLIAGVGLFLGGFVCFLLSLLLQFSFRSEPTKKEKKKKESKKESKKSK